jgi:hypothetical protein
MISTTAVPLWLVTPCEVRHCSGLRTGKINTIVAAAPVNSPDVTVPRRVTCSVPRMSTLSPEVKVNVLDWLLFQEIV